MTAAGTVETELAVCATILRNPEKVSQVTPSASKAQRSRGQTTGLTDGMHAASAPPIVKNELKHCD